MRNMINCDLENHFFDIDNMQDAETVLIENRVYKKYYNIYE